MAVEATVIVTQIVSTGSFIGISAWLAARWMNKVDKTAEVTEINRKADAKALAADLKSDAKSLAVDLKATVSEHRAEIKEMTNKLESHLEDIYGQLRIANGRTAKIEGGLLVIEKVCAERHGNGNGK